MAEDRGPLRAIAWQQLFPSLRLTTALRMALNFRALVLAALGVAGMVAGWRVLGAVFADAENEQITQQIELLGAWPWEGPPKVEPTDVLQGIAPPGVSPFAEFTASETWTAHGPLVVAWNNLSWPFRSMYTIAEAPSLASFVHLLCCALWALLIWSFFGGCITRMAAVAFARHENASLGQTVGFVNRRLFSYFWAPMTPILGTFLMAAFMAALGLLMRSDFGVLLASLVWVFVLLGSFMMAFILIGLFFGFPLMWSSISAEGTDSFGALSHSYSYTYQRPLHYLAYAIVAAALGVLGWILIGVFVTWIFQLSQWGVSWGTGMARWEAITNPEPLSPLADRGASIIMFWANCLHMLAVGFIFSYFWNASTVIYFLLRRQVDATELDEVFMPDEQDRHGLPPLKTGPDGVPVPADEPPPAEGASGRESGG